MKLNRNEKYVKWGLTAFLVIVAAGLFWLVFSNLRGFYDLIVEFLNNEKETSQMKKMILIAALTLVLTAAAVPGVATSFTENAGVSVCFFLGDLEECY